jgi:Na+/H+ antiporter NhaD/arsenite permease-like protein
MIQPVSALAPQAVFRGSNGTYGVSAKAKPSNTAALINAGGLATLAGGLTTIVARSHTSSWLHAMAVGTCAAFMALFFMTPQLIEKSNPSALSKKADAELLVKEDSKKFLDVVKEHIKPASKKIHFRQQA